MISYLIKNSSRPKDLVIDLFGGSGTTLMACEETDRTCFTMEIDEKYASAIVRRYAKVKGSTDDITCTRDGDIFKASEIYDFNEDSNIVRNVSADETSII